MLPDRVSNPGPLTYESGALPIALRGPASSSKAESLGRRIALVRLSVLDRHCPSVCPFMGLFVRLSVSQ